MEKMMQERAEDDKKKDKDDNISKKISTVGGLLQNYSIEKFRPNSIEFLR